MLQIQICQIQTSRRCRRVFVGRLLNPRDVLSFNMGSQLVFVSTELNINSYDFMYPLSSSLYFLSLSFQVTATIFA